MYSNKTTEEPKGNVYKLRSSPLIHTPGILAALQHQVAPFNMRHAVEVLTQGYEPFPEHLAHHILTYPQSPAISVQDGTVEVDEEAAWEHARDVAYDDMRYCYRVRRLVYDGSGEVVKRLVQQGKHPSPDSAAAQMEALRERNPDTRYEVWKEEIAPGVPMEWRTVSAEEFRKEYGDDLTSDCRCYQLVNRAVFRYRVASDPNGPDYTWPAVNTVLLGICKVNRPFKQIGVFAD